MLNQLPQTWAVTTLESLISFAIGGDWGKDQHYNDADFEEVLCIRASELRNWQEEKGSSAALRKIKKSSLEKRRLLKNDILVEVSGGGPEQPVGRTVIVDQSVLRQNSSTPKICTNFFRLIRPSTRFNGVFLNLFLQYFYKSGEISNFQAGSNNLRNLKFNDYLELEVPCAPIDEQKRIVAKIEALFSELDNGVAALKTAREQLKVYRQALLKHAFEGKLTADWRNANADKLETPEQLLAHIQREREKRYQQQLEDWQIAVKAWEAKGGNGKKPGKPKRLEKHQNKSDPDFSVPSEWAILELGSLAYQSILGKMLDKQKNVGVERPYLGNINVRWGGFETGSLKTMRIDDSETERYSVKRGDLIICEGGEPGRCAIWKEPDSGVCIQKALHRVRFTESYSAQFAFYYLLYSVPLERVVKHFTGTTIKHLTGAGLSKIQFPVCVLEEQIEVVKELDASLSRVKVLENEIDAELKKSETLRQSILKKAFSGQLVPQDPNDEPASELLVRIKAEKAAQQAVGKPVKKRKKQSV